MTELKDLFIEHGGAQDKFPDVITFWPFKRAIEIGVEIAEMFELRFKGILEKDPRRMID
jgi:hypothetical protein